MGGVLTVAAYHLYNLGVRPQKQSGLTEGSYTLHITNQCNTDLTLHLEAVDAEDGCRYIFDLPQMVVAAGKEQQVQLNVIPKTPLRGEVIRTYTFTVTAQPVEVPTLSQQIQGIWVQTPPAYEMNLRPQTQRGMAVGRFAVQIINLGQVNLSLRLDAMDAQQGCQYNFNPSQIVIPIGQERIVQLEVKPRTPLPTKETKPYPFTVTAQPVEISGFIQQVQGTWVQSPPELDLSLQKQEKSDANEGLFIIHISNRSATDVTVQWEAVGQNADSLFVFSHTKSEISAGDEQLVQLLVSSSSPPPSNADKTHPFTVNARLAEVPHLFWQVQGEWVQNVQMQEVQPIIPQQSATPSTDNTRRFFGCLIMLIGVVATIALGMAVGNFAYDVLRFGETETWIFVIIAWIIGVLVTRSIARKVTKG
jgi:hypothetical protein